MWASHAVSGTRRCAGRCLHRGPRWRVPRWACREPAGRAAPGQGPRVGGVQPGEPGQRADLAQPFGLHDVGEEPGQRGRHPVVRRRVKSSVGSGGGAAVKTSHSGVRRSGYSCCWSPLRPRPPWRAARWPRRPRPCSTCAGPGTGAAPRSIQHPAVRTCCSCSHSCSTFACSALAPAGGTASADRVCANQCSTRRRRAPSAARRIRECAQVRMPAAAGGQVLRPAAHGLADVPLGGAAGCSGS